MHISALPPLIHSFGASNSPERLAEIIKTTLIRVRELSSDGTLVYVSPAIEAECSIRLFSSVPHPGSVDLPRPLFSEGVARELFILSNERRGGARYPAHQPAGHVLKGWHVGTTEIARRVVLVCSAVWMSKEHVEWNPAEYSRPVDPLPAWMNREQAATMDFSPLSWRRLYEFKCRKCDTPAFTNPFNNRIWACGQCDYTTESVFVYFTER